MCKFVRPAPIIKLILTNSDRQRQASLWPVATTCAAATNTTRHGVGHPLRLRPHGPMCRQKRCLLQYPLPLGWRPHDAQPAGYKTGALYLRAGELCAAGHHSGSGRRAQHLLVPVRPDRCATGSPTNRAKGPGPHHGLLLNYWSWHLTVGLNILRIKADCLTFFSATRFPLQKANALLKPIQLDT